MHAIAIVLAAGLSLGPWKLTVPVEGLADDNAEEFAARIGGHFRALKDDHGDRIALEVRSTEGTAVITMNCLATLRLSDLGKALEGSRWSLKPATWELTGRAGFEWFASEAASPERLQALKAEVQRLAPKAGVVEVVALEVKKGAGYHLHVKLGAEPVPLAGLLGVLSDHGVKDAALIWERWPHMPWYDHDAGARLIPPKKS